MFSGIIEEVASIIKATRSAGLVRIVLSRPITFDDLKFGDSIATNGVCLTIEALTDTEITFALAAETLSVLGLSETDEQALIGTKLNLERSLKFGDRIHGHMVTGHVDSLAKVIEKKFEGESLILNLEIKKSVIPFIWKKGSVTLNGTSLTVNSIEKNIISVCLIPETLKRTNLGNLAVGDTVTVEPDYMARAVAHYVESRGI